MLKNVIVCRSKIKNIQLFGKRIKRIYVPFQVFFFFGKITSQTLNKALSTGGNAIRNTV